MVPRRATAQSTRNVRARRVHQHREKHTPPVGRVAKDGLGVNGVAEANERARVVHHLRSGIFRACGELVSPLPGEGRRAACWGGRRGNQRRGRVTSWSTRTGGAPGCDVQGGRSGRAARASYQDLRCRAPRGVRQRRPLYRLARQRGGRLRFAVSSRFTP